MNNLTSIVFHFCLNIFKFIDKNFSYEVVDGRQVVWLKIKYKDKEFVYSYSEADYLYFGSKTFGYNESQIYTDVMKDIGEAFKTLREE